MKNYLFVFILFSLLCCNKKEIIQADGIVINAHVYTVNSNFETAEAFAFKDGKFLAVGTSKEIQEKYASEKIIDAGGKTILPGFIDAHCHFLGFGQRLQTVDLVGTKSFEEVVQRVITFQNERTLDYITGGGWDQNDWDDKEFPTKALLDKLYPDTPIALTRIDGHALLCNQAALDLGKVTTKSKIEGGEVVIENGKLTGVLIDNAKDFVLDNWPKPTRQDKIQALLDAQTVCFEYGLTTVDDAGLDLDEIQLIDSLQQAGALKIRIYAMVSNKKENLDYYLENGIHKTERLNVRSFKVYADGALGSRGALMRKPYSDKANHFGLLTTSLAEMEELAEKIANSEFQMNTHAIGDSANHALLHIYNKALQGTKDRRWRIEHAQVVSPEDFENFNKIIPSVQPTHATSDMYWAEDRLGREREKGAYAFKQLLDAYGKVALGTDFPVEKVSPFLTFYASVARQDVKKYPKGGYHMENALSREETLRGMTIWAAYANFEENEKGSIEEGKFADFIILDKDIMKIEVHQIPDIKVEKTFVGGEEQ